MKAQAAMVCRSSASKKGRNRGIMMVWWYNVRGCNGGGVWSRVVDDEMMAALDVACFLSIITDVTAWLCASQGLELPL